MSGSCVSPRKGWFSVEVHPRTGNNLVVFARKSRGYTADFNREVWIPCLKCVPCVEVKGSALSARCLHEYEHQGAGCFGTLTYSNNNLPESLPATRSDAEKFIKNIDYYLRREGSKWRGVLVSERGGTTFRPHLHFLLFGVDLCLRSERVDTVDGEGRYDSELLKRCWPYGICDVRPMSPGRATYVGAHCIKNFHDPEAYRIMSRRPGVGFGWLAQYGEQLARHGFCVIAGQKIAVPPAYLRHPKFAELLEPVREKRREFALEQPDFNAPGEYQRRLSKAMNIKARRAITSGTL